MKKHFLLIILFFYLTEILILPQAMAAELEYAFSPKRGATNLIVKTIRSADKEILVAAYSFTSKTIAKALIDAKNRGVNVKIVMDHSQDLEPNSQLSLLLDYGIEVRINENYDIMHNKFMVIDSKTLQLGSFNYTWSAEKKNAENILVIKSEPVIVVKYRDEWQRLWDESSAR